MREPLISHGNKDTCTRASAILSALGFLLLIGVLYWNDVSPEESIVGMPDFTLYEQPPYPPTSEKNVWVFWHDLADVPLVTQMFLSSMLVSKGDSFNMYFITNSNAEELLNGVATAPYFTENPDAFEKMIQIYRTYVTTLRAASRKDFICGVLLASWGGVLIDPGIMVEDPDASQSRLEKWWQAMETENIQYFNFAYGDHLTEHNEIMERAGGTGFTDKYGGRKWKQNAWIDVYFTMARESSKSSIMNTYLKRVTTETFRPPDNPGADPETFGPNGRWYYSYFLYGSDTMDLILSSTVDRLCKSKSILYQGAAGAHLFKSKTGKNPTTGSPDNVLLLNVFDSNNAIDPMGVDQESKAVPCGMYKWLSTRNHASDGTFSCLGLMKTLWNRQQDKEHQTLYNELMSMKNTVTPGGGFFYYKFFNSAGDLKMKEESRSGIIHKLCNSDSSNQPSWLVRWIKAIAPSSNPCDIYEPNLQYARYMRGAAARQVTPRSPRSPKSEGKQTQLPKNEEPNSPRSVLDILPAGESSHNIQIPSGNL